MSFLYLQGTFIMVVSQSQNQVLEKYLVEKIHRLRFTIHGGSSETPLSPSVSLRIHCCLFDLALPSTPGAQFLLSVIFAWPRFSPPLLFPSRESVFPSLSPAPSPTSRRASAPHPSQSLIRDERSQAPEVRVPHTHVQEQRLIEHGFLLF